MPTCTTCSAHVSERFEKVFADENGDVLACPNCAANAGIADVALSRGKSDSS